MSYTKSKRSYFREYLNNHRHSRKILAINYKGGKCQRCGYDRCIAALEFHHRNPEDKKRGVDSRALSNCKWETAKKELDKCDLLCANCHREVEYGPMA